MHPTDAGRSLRKRREDQGLTQRELAELAGVSSTEIRHLEQGRRSDSGRDVNPRGRTLLSVAEALGPEDGVAQLVDWERPKLAEKLRRAGSRMVLGPRAIMKIIARPPRTVAFKSLATGPIGP